MSSIASETLSVLLTINQFSAWELGAARLDFVPQEIDTTFSLCISYILFYLCVHKLELFITSLPPVYISVFSNDYSNSPWISFHLINSQEPRNSSLRFHLFNISKHHL